MIKSKKNIFIIFCAVFISLIGILTSVEALEVPQYLGYSGRLTDSSNSALTDSYDMTFRIYDALSGGNLLWTEVQSAVSVSSGYFDVNLGDTTAFDLSFDKQYWVSIEIESDGEMDPRTPVNSVAYSFVSDVAYRAYATSTAPVVTSAGSLYFSTTTDDLYVYNGSSWIDLVLQDANGNVGVGTSTPTGNLVIEGTTGQNLFQIVTSTNQDILVVDDNGNVGIGTTSPMNAALNIEGATYGINGFANIQFKNNDQYWYLGTIGGGMRFVITTSTAHLTANTANFVFDIDTGNLALKDSENRGSTASYALDIVKTIDDANGTIISLENTSAGTDSIAAYWLQADEQNLGFGLYADGKGTYVDGIGEPAIVLDTWTSHPLVFNTNATARMIIDETGLVGIGTTTPTYGLHIGSAASGKNVMIAKGALCVDDDDNCVAALADGKIIAKSSDLSGADYAEYFYSIDTDLEPGEVVCVDIERTNAVKRCVRSSDSNIMGIVSSNPSIVGNAQDYVYGDDNYKVIGLLGQVKAKTSKENGEIRPGDSLTSASRPGYIMRANAGDPTVGVALEGTGSEIDVINVLISRKNKSITVEQVEEEITQRIANMEIEDEVNILISNAIDNLDLDSEIAENVDPKLLILDAKIEAQAEQLGLQIDSLGSDLINVNVTIEAILTDISDINQNLATMSVQVDSLGLQASSILAMLSGYGLQVEDHEQRIAILKDSDFTINEIISNMQLSLEGIEVGLTGYSSFTEGALVIESTIEQFIKEHGEALTFVGEVKFKEHVAFNEDTVGRAVVEVGQTIALVEFVEGYKYTPVVTLTPIGIFDIRYGIKEASATAFIIEIDPVQEEDIEFNWHAFAANKECSGEHLDLCITEGYCQEAGLYWYDNLCNVGPEPEPVVELASEEVVADVSGGDVGDGAESDEVVIEEDLTLPEELESFYAPEGKPEPEIAPELEPAIEPEEGPVIILGCMNEAAENYNPKVIEDDGTCILPETEE